MLNKDVFLTTRAGVGSYSQVVSAIDTATGQSVAIKVFRPWSPTDHVAPIVDRIETAQPGRTPMVYRDLVETLVREASFVESAGVCVSPLSPPSSPDTFTASPSLSGHGLHALRAILDRRPPTLTCSSCPQKHPNIVKILGICIDAPAMIMEKASSDLYHVIAQKHQSVPVSTPGFPPSSCHLNDLEKGSNSSISFHTVFAHACSQPCGGKDSSTCSRAPHPLPLSPLHP